MKDSSQILVNLKQLQIENLMIQEWKFVHQVLQQLLITTKATPAPETSDDFNESASRSEDLYKSFSPVQGEEISYKIVPMNYNSNNGRPSVMYKIPREEKEGEQSSEEESSDSEVECEVDGVRYARTNILKPADVFILINGS
jgi:hypothetical protein